MPALSKQPLLSTLLIALISTASNAFTSPQQNRPFLKHPLPENLLVLSAKPNDDMTPNTTPPKKSSLFSPKTRRSLLLSIGLGGLTNLGLAYAAPPGFKRIPTQFIAALGDPSTTSGTNANDWGLWPVDPGPRGVFLRDYETKILSSSRAPAGWSFDKNDWWLEEHGLIMEAPSFPLETGRYLVTGGRVVTTVLTVTEGGGWQLENGKLYDVTHLPCRSARYKPAAGGSGGGGPLTARERDFPVKPGAEMPKVEGCDKQDYAVLFVIGKEVTA